MRNISILIKPASSSCNLRCSYCFYNDVSENRCVANYGILSLEKASSLIDKAISAIDDNGTVNLAFQGGEPTIAGLDWFKEFVNIVNSKINKQKVNYALQTNCTLVNEDWCKFFYDNHFLIGISLDGSGKNMDKFRLDANGNSVFIKIMKNIELLKKYKVEFNILTVVTESLAKDPEKLYDFYSKNKLEYIQLIPCLPSLNDDHIMDKEALTPESYADFYKSFFDKWYKGTVSGKMMSVNLFDNLIEMINGRMPYQCGMLGKCQNQYVLEGDGSVYPCDFFVLDQYSLGNIESKSFKEMSEGEVAKNFVNGFAENDYCQKCKYVGGCHGGCKRQNVCYLKKDYCGYKEVLDYCLPRLSKII